MNFVLTQYKRSMFTQTIKYKNTRSNFKIEGESRKKWVKDNKSRKT